MIPGAVVFDIDNTLVESRQPLSEKMAGLLGKLLEKTKVGLISGGKFQLFARNILDHLPSGADLNNLFLLPTSGAALYIYAAGWQLVYLEQLSQEEMERIRDALTEAARGIIDFSAPAQGERIELRGSQVTLSALGQDAPLKEKEAWDQDQKKRRALVARLKPLLPEYDLKIGGTTSVDVTKHGINKAFGVLKLSEHLHVPIGEMLYIGDALFPGGNDEVVKETGIATKAVKRPRDTEHAIEALLYASR